MTTLSSGTDGAATDQRLAYTVADAARALSIGRSTLYKFLQSGELASINLGARRLILREDLDRFVQTRRDAQADPKVA